MRNRHGRSFVHAAKSCSSGLFVETTLVSLHVFEANVRRPLQMMARLHNVSNMRVALTPGADGSWTGWSGAMLSRIFRESTYSGLQRSAPANLLLLYSYFSSHLFPTSTCKDGVFRVLDFSFCSWSVFTRHTHLLISPTITMHILDSRAWLGVGGNSHLLAAPGRLVRARVNLWTPTGESVD